MSGWSAATCAAKRGQPLEPIVESDMRGRLATIELEPLETPQAVFVVFRCAAFKSRLLAIVGPRRQRTAPAALEQRR